MGVGKLFRQIFLFLCGLVYGTIPDIYDLFYRLSKSELFTDENISQFSNNVYVLISVVMLFVFSIKLIQAIVMPDLLVDSKKGVAGVFKRAIIGLGLIVATPFIFGLLYDVQDRIIDKSVIQKLILGINISSDGNSTASERESINCSAATISSNISIDSLSTPSERQMENSTTDVGQLTAASALYGFLHINGAFDDSNAIVYFDSSHINDIAIYNCIMTKNINDIDSLSDSINDIQDGEYVFEFNGLMAIVTGVFLLYELILFCMDSALRLVKLGFYQLIAPIIILAYILTGDETLNKYIKEVGSTFTQVFVRLAAIAFYIYILSQIDTIIDNLDSNGLKIWGRFFIIIGALQFVKLLPDLIGNLLGVKMQSKGGIRGRLGEMAMVGNLAQRAWDTLRAHPLAPVTGAGGALMGAGTHIVAAGANAYRRGAETARTLRENGHGRIRSALGAVGSFVPSAAGGLLTTLGAAGRGARTGWQNRNLRGAGQEYNRYMRTHAPGVTLRGRIGASVRDYFGADTRQDELTNRVINRLRNGKIQDPTGTRIIGRYTDVDGNQHNYDEEQFKRDQEALQQQIAEVQRAKSEHDTNISQIQAIESNRKAMMDEAKQRIARGDSTITMASVAGNFKTKLRLSNGSFLTDASGNDIEVNATDYRSKIDDAFKSGRISESDRNVLLNNMQSIFDDTKNMNLNGMQDYVSKLQTAYNNEVDPIVAQNIASKLNDAKRILSDMEKAATEVFINDALTTGSNTVINENLAAMNSLMSAGSGSYAAEVATHAGVTTITSFSDLEAMKRQADADTLAENVANNVNNVRLQNLDNTKIQMDNAAAEAQNAINEEKRSERYVNAGRDREATNAGNNSNNNSNGNRN